MAKLYGFIIEVSYIRMKHFKYIFSGLRSATYRGIQEARAMWQSQVIHRFEDSAQRVHTIGDLDLEYGQIPT